MNCSKCGESNDKADLTCAACGALLEDSDGFGPGPAPSTMSQPTLAGAGAGGGTIAMAATSAAAPYKQLSVAAPAGSSASTRFLLIYGACMGALLAATLYYGDIADAAQEWLGSEAIISADLALLIPYAILILVSLAYIIAKTGEVCGEGFGSTFAMALFPPLYPAIWARMGGRPMWLPYAYILLDAAIIGALIPLSASRPDILPIAIGVMLPFMIYHALGCAVGRIGDGLGFNANFTLFWICCGPYMLGLVLMTEVGIASFGMSAVSSSAQTVAARPDLFQAFFDVAVYRGSVIAYGVATWAAWIVGVVRGLNTS